MPTCLQSAAGPMKRKFQRLCDSVTFWKAKTGVYFSVYVCEFMGLFEQTIISQHQHCMNIYSLSTAH